MVQWAIASRPGHPVVCRMGQYVAKHVAEEQAGDFVDADRDHAILERTGPGIWSDSVHDYLKQVRRFPASVTVHCWSGHGLLERTLTQQAKQHVFPASKSRTGPALSRLHTVKGAFSLCDDSTGTQAAEVLQAN